MTIHLFENTILEWKDGEQLRRERILWIDPSNTKIVTINIDDDSLPALTTYAKIEKAFNEMQVEKSIHDPYASLTSLENDKLPPKYITTRDTAWAKIKDLVGKEPYIYDSDTRGKLIQDIADNFKTYPANIYQYLKKYWKRGKRINALLPDYQQCGGKHKDRLQSASLIGPKRGRPSTKGKYANVPTGVNITPELLEIFKADIEEYYLNPNKNFSLNRTFDYVKADITNLYNSKEWQEKIKTFELKQAPSMPKFGQFRYWYYRERNKDYANWILAKEGERKFAKKNRPVIGNATAKAFGPGSVYEIDSTPLDVYLVNSNNRSVVVKKRPIMYLVIDVFSRMVVGFHIAFENASWNSIRKALFNTMTNKAMFCEQYDIPITENQWPSHHIPRVVFSDNGKEILSKNSNNLKQLGITISNARPYTPDYKPFVERFFQKFNQAIIHTLPGSIHKDSQERGMPKPIKYAEASLYDLIQLVTYTALKFNMEVINDYPSSAHMIADGLVCSPINLWTWGIKNRSGLLREETPDTIKYTLLPRKEVSIGKKGIYFGNDMYYISKSISNAGLTIRKIGRHLPKVEVIYDPDDMRIIYMKKAGSNELEACTLTQYGKKYTHYNLEDIENVGEIGIIQTEEYQDKIEPTIADYNKKIEGNSSKCYKSYQDS